ncbi:NADPH:quinone reductase [Streptomyces sp. NPDC058221]|uniref:NADPH:quinone reductase n=1 Tax=Streptomyces sp. NPDC058221 TaxID=3346388 RepID=UPI0036E29288
MKAIIYSSNGGSDVLQAVERPVLEPGPGEVRVKVHVSGVNPTDWKSRQGSTGSLAEGDEQVPNQDGAGRIEAVGEGVDASRIGERVWLYEAAHGRPHGGTAQEFTTIPAGQAVPLPDTATFDLGAGLGVPALTAHRALTLAEDGPRRLAPGALAGRSVLVAGGAGAVGNAAIQLARWAGATVLSTVSSPQKAELATAAGAEHVVNYRTGRAVDAIRAIVPDGVDLVVEVAPAVNAALDAGVLRNNGTVAYYANNGGDSLTLPVRDVMGRNLAWHGLLLYTLPAAAKADAVAAVSAAVAAGAMRIGEDAGLPLHRFPLAETAKAHEAVEGGAVGKVLIDVADA